MILEVAQVKPYTVATIRADGNGATHAIGIAKWNPKDEETPGWEWDELRGAKIAIMRCALHYREAQLRHSLGQPDYLDVSDLSKYDEQIGRLWKELGFDWTENADFLDNKGINRALDRLIKDLGLK